jgi:hypothetical protein
VVAGREPASLAKRQALCLLPPKIDFNCVCATLIRKPER